MEKTQFDRIVKSLAAGNSRRDVLKKIAAMAAGGAVVMTGASSVAAGKAWGHSKVPVCHKGRQFKMIPVPALKGHSKHGDVVCDTADPCRVLNGTCPPANIALGECGWTAAAAGTACVDATSGLASTCDGLGTCTVVEVDPPGV